MRESEPTLTSPLRVKNSPIKEYSPQMEDDYEEPELVYVRNDFDPFELRHRAGIHQNPPFRNAPRSPDRNNFK